MRVRNRRVLGVVGGVRLRRRRGEVSARGRVRRMQGLRRRRRRVDGRGRGRRGGGHRGAEGEVGAKVRAARSRGAGETEVKVQIHPPAAPRGLIGVHATASACPALPSPGFPTRPPPLTPPPHRCRGLQEANPILTRRCGAGPRVMSGGGYLAPPSLPLPRRISERRRGRCRRRRGGRRRR
jgi:hypothetical protein